MRYDYLQALKKLYPELNNIDDIFCIIKSELKDLDSAITAFNLETKEVVLNKDESDKSYEMIPIKKNDATIGISIKRVKKENNNEQFTLIKNIIPQNNLNVYNVSSLEKVVTKNYTIFFAISRIIFKYKTSLYYIDNEKLKILVYDNSAIDEYIENIETAVGDFYQALEKIEDYLRHQKCLSPDYTSKLECNYSKIKTDNEVEMFCMNNDYKINNFRMNRVMPYYCFFCDDDEKTNFNNRYSKFLAYMDQEKITLPIDTLFTPTDKTIGSYFVETEEKVYKKR